MRAGEHYKESDRMHKGKKTKRQIFLLHFQACFGLHVVNCQFKGMKKGFTQIAILSLGCIIYIRERIGNEMPSENAGSLKKT
jgi:hypothetical protein